MELVKPSLRYQQSYIDYIVELGDEERYPFPLDFDHQDFDALLQKNQDFADGVNLPEGYVASETYWLVDGTEIVGVANLRLRLNDAIRHCGGHIGLGIRPSYRGKGLGIELMRQMIALAKSKGINELHIHCYKSNIASAKMIMANGGVLDSEIDIVVQDNNQQDNQSNNQQDNQSNNQQDNAAAIIQRYRVS